MPRFIREKLLGKWYNKPDVNYDIFYLILQIETKLRTDNESFFKKLKQISPKFEAITKYVDTNFKNYLNVSHSAIGSKINVFLLSK